MTALVVAPAILFFPGQLSFLLPEVVVVMPWYSVDKHDCWMSVTESAWMKPSVLVLLASECSRCHPPVDLVTSPSGGFAAVVVVVVVVVTPLVLCSAVENYPCAAAMHPADLAETCASQEAGMTCHEDPPLSFPVVGLPCCDWKHAADVAVAGVVDGVHHQMIATTRMMRMTMNLNQLAAAVCGCRYPAFEMILHARMQHLGTFHVLVVSSYHHLLLFCQILCFSLQSLEAPD